MTITEVQTTTQIHGTDLNLRLLWIIIFVVVVVWAHGYNGLLLS